MKILAYLPRVVVVIAEYCQNQVNLKKNMAQFTYDDNEKCQKATPKVAQLIHIKK